jgi:hypothetical protein
VQANWPVACSGSAEERASSATASCRHVEAGAIAEIFAGAPVAPCDVEHIATESKRDGILDPAYGRNRLWRRQTSRRLARVFFVNAARTDAQRQEHPRDELSGTDGPSGVT